VGEAVEVTIRLEQLAANRAPDFVYSIAKDEPAIENRDPGLGDRDELAVEKDNHD
jgi:hypothetical protein